MPKSYTRTGDDGTTGRFGGARLKKSSPLIAVLGALDEANAAIGLARALSQHEPSDELDERLEKLQHLLFRIGADLSTSLDHTDPRAPRLIAADTREIEKAIDTLDVKLGELRKFILPRGTPAASALHLSRAIVRRAERAAIHAREAGESFNPEILPYLNRLSSYLFALARWANKQKGAEEKHPHYRAEQSQSP